MELLYSHIAATNIFHPIEDRDIPFLIRKFRDYKSRSCDYSIGGLIMWKDYFNYEWAIVEDSLLIRGLDPVTDTRLYYRPVGSLPVSSALTVFKEDAVDKKAIFIDYEEDAVVFESEESSGLRKPMYISKPEWDEYVYDINRFIGFPGKKMEKKRNHLNYFVKHYDYRIEDLSDRDNEDVIDFSKSLDLMHDSEMFRYENSECIRMLRQLQDTPMIGICIIVDDKIIGYAFGEIIGDVYFAHVEKGDPEYHGIYQLLASEMARRAALKGALYVNREEDMGVEHLRKSKESYKPSMMIRKRLYLI